MNYFRFYSICLLLFVCSCVVKAQCSKVFEIDFEGTQPGAFSQQNLIEEFDSLRWTLLDDRAAIVQDQLHGKVLQVAYPKGAVGPEKGGIQFIRNLPPAPEYYLDYYVKFEDGFDFRLGGKLPGLTSGGSEYTGGKHPVNGEGWSARYMWVKKGEVVVYFYYLDMDHEYGDPIKLNVFCQTGKWYRLTQRIKLNENNLKNGILQVWVNGKEVLNKNDVRFRLWNKGLIDSFYFSTFFGGATQEWAPQNDSFALFDDIYVGTQAPEFLNSKER